jgi:hypothetical protein
MKKLGILIGCFAGGILIGAGAVAWLARPSRLDDAPQDPPAEPRPDARDAASGSGPQVRKEPATSDTADGERAPFVGRTAAA